MTEHMKSKETVFNQAVPRVALFDSVSGVLERPFCLGEVTGTWSLGTACGDAFVPTENWFAYGEHHLTLGLWEKKQHARNVLGTSRVKNFLQTYSKSSSKIYLKGNTRKEQTNCPQNIVSKKKCRSSIIKLYT